MTTPATPAKDGYLPALDGLRAVAVGAVLASHFLPFGHWVNRSVHWGRLGVILFFVLSGFLITGILLRNRVDPAGEAGLGRPLGTFYLRRVLRIFPIYYLTIAIAAGLGYGPVADHLSWHLSYTASPIGEFFGVNFHSAVHLWSLCVEEQFYLFWPWVVFLVPVERLGIALGVMILGSIGFKVGGGFAGWSWESTNFTVFGCLDSLGIGALLAWSRFRARPAGWNVGSWLGRSGLWIGLPLLIGLEWFRARSHGDARLVLGYRALVDLAAGLTFATIVGAVADGRRHPALSALASAPIRYLGKISYGIYLYHLFLIPLGAAVSRRLGMAAPVRGWPMLGAYSVLSVVVASLSWYGLESPLNRLKRLVPYASRSVEPIAPPLAPPNKSETAPG